MGLNRPAKKNAFTLQMLSDLSTAYQTLEDSPELRVGVLFPHGYDFTVGLDLAEVGPAVTAGNPLFPPNQIDPLDLWGPRRKKPIVCATAGWCLTIGIELLLASDIRIAAVGSKFRQMEPCRGIMPFGGATLRFPRVAGWGNAMRYILTGAQFDAKEAFRMGIVQEICEPGTLLPRAIELATQVAEQAPLAVQSIRESARTAEEQGIPAAKAILMKQAVALFHTDDAKEGVDSFVERRPAAFKGK